MWWLSLLLVLLHPANQLVSPCDSGLNCTTSDRVTQSTSSPEQEHAKMTADSTNTFPFSFKENVQQTLHLFTSYSFGKNEVTNDSREDAWRSSNQSETRDNATLEDFDKFWDDGFEFITANATDEPTKNSNVSTIPHDVRPPRELETYFLTAVYVIILLGSVTGNATVGFVILTNGHLRTSTFYHLFSLSVAELILAMVGIPTNIWWLWQDSFWPEGQVSCIVLDAMFEAANFASVLNVVCVSVEVYVLICRPHIAKVWVNEIHAKMAVAAIWFVSFGSSIAVAFCIRQYWEADNRTITSVGYSNMSAVTGTGNHAGGTAPATAGRARTGCLKTLPFYTDKFNLISIAGLYITLMVLLAVLYAIMSTRLKNTTGKMAKTQAALRKKCESMTSITAATEEGGDSGQQDSSADQHDSFTPSRPVTMLGTVVAIVCLSRMFYYVISILDTIAPRMLRLPQFASFGEYVAMATRVVFYLSGVVVPAVYVGMSVQFRRGLKWTCKRLVMCRWQDRKRRRAKVLKGRLPPATAASNQTIDTAGYNSEDDLDFELN